MTDFKLDTFQAQNFRVQFERLPHVAFMCNRFQVPGISGGSVQQNTIFNPIPHAGDSIQYEMMQIVFNLDEDWKNFIEVQKWLHQINFPQTFDQYRSLETEELETTSHAKVMLMNNANRPIKELEFFDCFPVSLTGFSLDATISSPEPIPITATFAYNFYQIA